MTDLKTGFKNISKFIEDSSNKSLKEMSFYFLSRVQSLTPVDTGRARAGWMLENKKENEIVVLNNVNYIIYLEHGHSRQAPSGMTRITIEEIKGKIK